jgi:ABC-type molybdate transport system permease subunit
MSILVTRPEPGASRTLAALTALDKPALAAPLFEIVQTAQPRPSGRFAALLVTSQNGAAGLSPASSGLAADLPVFAVGDRTAQALRDAGFMDVTSASGDQKALTRLVLARLSTRYRVLLATGEDHKDGLPAAFAAVRGTFPAKAGLNAFLLAPQMMPGMVIGIATLFFGAYIAFRASNTMLVLALSVFCMPFVIRITMARLSDLDPRLDEASANLGAGKIETFVRVTLPQLGPALLAAAAFTFIEAFDNVTVALFTSDVRGRPLPVELYYLVQNDSTPAIAAISAIEIGLSFLVMLILGRTVGLERLGGPTTKT